MSVCLAVTKTIAVSSLGIYCGAMCSAAVLARFTPMDVIKSQLMGPAKIVARIAASLATISSVFFGLSFFGAPAHLRHPYLLYGMLVTPVSGLYMAATMRFRRPRQCRSKCPRGQALERRADEASSVVKEDATDATASSLDDSVVDLGEHSAATPSQTNPAPVEVPPAEIPAHHPPVTCHSSRCLAPVPVLFGISVVGFVQSVLGLYGEGLFV
ncbi:LANO_0D09802g1_1 [Lachancea nothofagi CBS 11611]|uniref:LANO_0D09802g1_1 n=1 Tax=Lachancea nothofagi CBS 11611 TaxID=1266666 RepID=A0A1G4JJW3_9SACH|nr:LANO_0D09802g1_1 [Lachancea nothofagi CBS 11611]